jgi:hypothetical protein
MANFSVNEDAKNAVITVTRTGDTVEPAAVDFQTVDDSNPLDRCDSNTGLASSRCDFATTIDTLRFAAGETVKTFSIPVFDDAHQENAETLHIKLSNPRGATLGAPNVAVLTIVDNDDAPAAQNPIDNSTFFVGMHYLDFLSREAEPDGLNAWTGVLNRCTGNSPECDRVTVSSAFFRSQEFQLKGFFVYRFYQTALGRLPTYAEIVPDMRRVSGATAEEVNAKREAFTNEFMARAEFRARFDGTTDDVFVDRLLGTAGVTLASRDQLVADLNNGRQTRAQVLRAILDSVEVCNKEYNSAFVAMQYFGYLRRDPDAAGFNAWLNYLNEHPSDYRTMVNGFENSIEYRLRFGRP